MRLPNRYLTWPIALLIGSACAQAAESNRVFLRKIVVESEAEATRVIEQLDSGLTFAEAARRFSTHATAPLGGFVGPVRDGDGSESVFNAARTLQPGSHGRPLAQARHWTILYRMPSRFREKAYRLQDQGDELLAQGKIEEAITAYKQSIESHPGHVHSYLSLGLAYGQAGKPGLEEAYYRKAIDLAPDFHEAHHNLGALLWTRQDVRGAIRAFRKALEIKPDLYKVYVNLSTIHRSLGENAAAVKAARQALRLNPLLAGGYYSLGAALQAQGDLKGALENYRRAAVLSPSNPGFQLTAAVTQARAGEVDRAVVALQDLVRRFPDNQAAKQALDTLEEYLAKKRRTP